MLKKHSQLFEGLFTATDLFVVSAAWIASYWLRFQSGWIEVDKGVPPFSDYLRMLIFVWLIWAYVFRRFGLYRPMRGVNRFREVWLVVRANTFSVLLLLAVTYLFHEKSVPFSRLVFLIFWGFSLVVSIGSRSLIRSFLRKMRRRGYNLRYALIVGSGPLAARVADKILAHPEFGFELVGFLSNEKQRMQIKGITGFGYPGNNGRVRMRVNGAPEHYGWAETKWQETVDPDFGITMRIIGTYLELPRILAQGKIDQVIIALPLEEHHRLESIVSSIGDAIVDVRIVPDLQQFIQLGSHIEEFDGIPVVSITSTPLAGVNRVMKRIFDLTVGTIFLVVSLPLMILLLALVKLTSRGPIFFTQERVGLDGRRFNIYKFRTMYLDAEADGARFAIPKDPRVTPLGRLLRRFNLDELPQLVNVIGGHMSLVGPRPERPVFIQEFRRHVPKYMLRHKVQAGMTGWAQVNGWRGNTSISRRIEHDLFYIENWSLALDLKILGLTMLNGFRDRNAY